MLYSTYLTQCFPEKKITVAIITLGYDFYGLVDTNLLVVQSLGCVWLCQPMDCNMPGFPAFTISLSLLKLMSTESMMPFNHLILCLPLLLLPSFFPSIRVFSSEPSLRRRWLKYQSYNISPSNEWTGLVRVNWFDFLAVQGTLKSLLQNHNSKASILWHSASFMIQLSYPYDYWKNQSFDYTGLCQQSNVSAF